MSHPDKIELTIEEKSYLQALIESKEVAPRVSDRAKILLLRSERRSVAKRNSPEATYDDQKRSAMSG